MILHSYKHKHVVLMLMVSSEMLDTSIKTYNIQDNGNKYTKLQMCHLLWYGTRLVFIMR